MLCILTFTTQPHTSEGDNQAILFLLVMQSSHLLSEAGSFA